MPDPKKSKKAAPSTLVSGRKMRLVTEAKLAVKTVCDELQAADASGSANVDVPAAVRKLTRAFTILDEIDGRRKQYLDPSVKPAPAKRIRKR